MKSSKTTITLSIAVKTKKYRINVRHLETILAMTCGFLGIRRAMIGLVLVGNRAIRRLNSMYKHSRAATDVLAFPFAEQIRVAPRKSIPYLGDIVVSLDQTKIQAKQFRVHFNEELYRYVIHGLLHLVGYVDYTDKDRRRMIAKQEKILAACLQGKGRKRFDVKD
jgi:rRNA maturation RNase YbeY